MSGGDSCKITDFKDSKDFVKVTFSPDLQRFQMTRLDDDIVSLMTKRVYDIAGCCGVKVWLNGRKLPTSDFKSYVDMYFPPKDQQGIPGYVKWWCLIACFCISDRMSFCWSLCLFLDNDGRFLVFVLLVFV